MLQKERLGEQPDCDDIDDMKLFEKSPSKQEKQMIVARQRADREKQSSEDRKFKTMQRQVKQDNLQSLE